MVFKILLAILAAMPATRTAMADQQAPETITVVQRDVAIETLLARFNNLCLKSFPNQGLIAKTAGSLGLKKEDLEKFQHIIHGDPLRAWVGELGGNSPIPQRELDLVVGSSLKRGCLVGSFLNRPLGSLPEFEQLVHGFSAKLMHGQLVDTCKDIPADAYAESSFLMCLEWVSKDGSENQLFSVSVGPPEHGWYPVSIGRIFPIPKSEK